MRKLFSLAMVVAVALGMTSCSKDVDYGNEVDEGDLVATFTLQTPKGAFVTYADPTIGDGEEWTVNNIDIYAFLDENMIGGAKLTKDTDYEVTSADGAAVTTIKVNSSWLAPRAGKEVQFYFVGNDIAGATGAIKATHVDPDKITKTAFEAQVTKPLDVDAQAIPQMSELIRTPLLFTAKAEPVTLIGRIQAKAPLTRREARFDILNKHAAEAAPNNLVITAIKISNAPRSGKIFADGGSDAIEWAGIDYTKIDVPAYPADYTEEQDARYPSNPLEKTYRAKSVFYLYPTIVGEDAAHTEIIVEATMGGQPYTFTRAKKDAQGNAIEPKEITANYRYTLVLDPLSLEYTITKAGYTDGGEIETVTGGDDSFGSFKAKFGATDLADDADSYKVDFGKTTDKLVLTVETKFGTAAEEPKFSAGDASMLSITKSTPVVTYGYKTVDTYTIGIAEGKTAATFLATLNIVSPNGDATKTITLSNGEMTSDDIKEVVNGNEDLAAIIEEAIKNLPTYTEGDPITAEDLAAVDKINVGGAGSPVTSLDGIENLPGLTEINAAGNENLTGSIDLSGNPGLVTVDLSNTNINEIDLSNNPELINIKLNGTGITEIDVTENTELITLDVTSTAVKEIDLSNNSKLTTLNAMSTEITEIDVSNCPVLFNVNISKTDVKSIDFSNNTELRKIEITHLDIESVDLSMITHLNYLDVSVTNLTSLDLSGNPYIQHIVMNLTKFTSIDIKTKGSLQRFSAISSALTELDILHCKSLKTVQLTNCPQLILVKTWTDFPVEDPGSFFTLFEADSHIKWYRQ